MTMTTATTTIATGAAAADFVLNNYRQVPSVGIAAHINNAVEEGFISKKAAELATVAFVGRTENDLMERAIDAHRRICRTAGCTI